jgi:hypothetical protein
VYERRAVVIIIFIIMNTNDDFISKQEELKEIEARERYTESEFTDYIVCDVPTLSFHHVTHASRNSSTFPILCLEDYMIMTTPDSPLQVVVRLIKTLAILYTLELDISNTEIPVVKTTHQTRLGYTPISHPSYIERRLSSLNVKLSMDTGGTRIDLLNCSSDNLYFLFGSSADKYIQIHSISNGDMVRFICT